MKIEIYNSEGKIVKRIERVEKTGDYNLWNSLEGYIYQTEWDLLNDSRRGISSGIYM